MVVSEVNITPVKPHTGLVAFVSCVIDGQLYLGSIGIHQYPFTDEYRITYPTKKIGKKHINYYHPITQEAGRLIEAAILAKCEELFERSDEIYGRHGKDTDTGTKPASL